MFDREAEDDGYDEGHGEVKCQVYGDSEYDPPHDV